MVQKKNSHFFLAEWLSGPPGTFPGPYVSDDETAAFRVVRLLNTVLAGKKGVLAVPAESEAEILQSEISLLCRAMGLPIRSVLLPEGTWQGNLVPEGEAPRSEALDMALSPDPPELFIASVHSLISPVPDPGDFESEEKNLKVGDKVSLTALAADLVKMGYDDEPEASVSGEFSRRGGILDIFSPGMALPVRIEFFGDEIDSIREYSPENGRSVRETQCCRILARSGTAQPEPGESGWSDFSAYMRENTFLLTLHPALCRKRLEKFGGTEGVTRWELFKSHPFLAADLPDPVEAAEEGIPPDDSCRSVIHALMDTAEEEQGAFDELESSLAMEFVRRHLNEGWRVFLASAKSSDHEHFTSWLKRSGLEGAPGIRIEDLALPSGLMLPGPKVLFIAERELFPAALERRRRAPVPEEEPDPEKTAQAELEHMADIDEGDIVVHINYGICIFRGIRTVQSAGGMIESLELEFADDTVCHVPVWQAHLVSRYIGAKASVTKLSRLGSSHWKKVREEAASSARNLAVEMLRMQAVRSSSRGEPFPHDDLEQRVFEDSFPFEATSGQLKASDEIKRDMEKPKPMDRLLCGDVGYGKTEVAMRAAFKCVSSGRQAAVLVPTTVLAKQHYLSFRERFAEYPFVIETLSRLRTPAEKASILRRLASGGVDIVIGTHALLSPEIRFKDLGLLIIDEEQRFGVEDKDRLKAARLTVDVLTMTATPIPRTLHMSMTGLRDLSAITTAPTRRLPVHTVVAQMDAHLVKSALLRELERGGQAFYLYNRVQSIETAVSKLQVLLPEARIAAAHGQMRSGALEEVMGRFVDGQIDILVCTTIIESGIDIPNVNTIIIERADRFGLAELHQLRGRVGRWNRQAYAYMLLPPSGIMTGDARERMNVIRKYTHLGAGFKLALNDLRIRGAGNIIGAEQSGHVDNIGFHLYCQLLREASFQLQGVKNTRIADASVSLEFLDYTLKPNPGRLGASLPPAYIAEERLRLDAYRRLARMSSEEEVDDFAEELRDRFGPVPQEAKNFLAVTRIRIMVAELGYFSLAVRDGMICMENKSGLYRRNNVLPKLPVSFKPGERLEMLTVFLKQVRMEQQKYQN